MIKSDFDLPSVKEFAGFLTAWLIYHVAAADQKIRKDELLSDSKIEKADNYVDCFLQSIKYVYETMVEQTNGAVTYSDDIKIEDGIRIKVGITGDYGGEIVFTFPNNTTINMVKALTFMESNHIDEVAHSALSEVANIISGSAASLISGNGKEFDIKTPEILSGNDDTSGRNGFYFETELGSVAVSVNIE
jgi:CheY-specific phosphatase CheX